MRFLLSAAIAGAIAIAGTGDPFAQAPNTKPFVIQALTSPAAGDDSSEPQLTSDGIRTILSWIELDDDFRATLKFAERTPSGWTEARAAASGQDFFVNSADVPSVRALANGTLAAHWLQANGDGEAYNLLLSWSKDGGRTWSRPTMPHHDGTQTQHGFASLFQAPGGGLGVVWLDGRATNPEAAPGTDPGNMALRAAVYDANARQQGELAIDARVCECCSTAVALTDEGPIVAYRDRSADELRDIHVSRLAGGRWTAPVAVSNDRWELSACPVNGPAVSARGRNVAVAWFTAASGDGRAFLAFSDDAGRTFGRPIRIDDESALGRVDVELLNDGSTAVTWIEFAAERSNFKVRRVAHDGTRGPAATIGPMGGVRYPRTARHGNDLLFAWTAVDDTGTQHVRTARAALTDR